MNQEILGKCEIEFFLKIPEEEWQSLASPTWEREKQESQSPKPLWSMLKDLKKSLFCSYRGLCGGGGGSKGKR